MRWTAVLCKRSKGFGWRMKLQGKKMQFPDYPVRIPKALIDRGIEVEEPGRLQEKERWTPPADDPRFFTPPKYSEQWNHNEDPAFVATPRICIYQGVKQVAALIKAQVFQELPPSVSRLVDTINVDDNVCQLLQQYIMQAQYWNPTMEKLPKRIDSRKPGWKFQAQYGIPPKLQGRILARNLLRLCQSQVSLYPSLSDRRHIYQPHINSHFMYRGEPVVVRGMPEWMITSSKPLARYADESTVDASVTHKVPDLYPLLPTIDLIQDHNYTLDSSMGMKADWSHSQLHTFVILDDNRFKTDSRMGRDLIFCMGYAAAKARYLYGDGVTTLPEPVCVQSVSLDHATFNFACLQLNTLDLSSDSGVKNLAWVQPGLPLFNKILSQPWMPKAIRYERLEDFDPLAYQTLAALMLNGASELA